MWYHGIKSQSFGFNLTKGFLPPYLTSSLGHLPHQQGCHGSNGVGPSQQDAPKNLDFLIFKNSWTMWNPCETLPICGRELLRLEFTKAYCAYCATDGWSPISFQTWFPTAQKQWMIITHQGPRQSVGTSAPESPEAEGWLTKRKKNKRPSRNPNCSDCINCLLKKWKTLGGLRFEAYNGYFHKLWYSKAFPNLHIPLKSMSFALSRISD